MRIVTISLIAALALAACKKKEGTESQTTDKTAEGTAAAPTAAPQPDPAAKPVDPAVAPAEAPKTILVVAKDAGQFNTLLKAIEAAGLTETLSGAGPFTVLAPTDEAFAKIPAADLEVLLGDKAKLTALLTTHVSPGAVASKDLATAKTVKTVAGAELPVDSASGKVGGATIVKADIAASNGVIHAIDTVIIAK